MKLVRVHNFPLAPFGFCGQAPATPDAVIAWLSDRKTARLELADGSIFKGYSFGHDESSSGEVVFNTGVVKHSHRPVSDHPYSLGLRSTVAAMHIFVGSVIG